MSKTKDTSDFGRATLEDHRPLADSEVDAASGGFFADHVRQLLANSVGASPDARKGGAIIVYDYEGQAMNSRL
jgi:hypothetical protein